MSMGESLRLDVCRKKIYPRVTLGLHHSRMYDLRLRHVLTDPAMVNSSWLMFVGGDGDDDEEDATVLFSGFLSGELLMEELE